MDLKTQFQQTVKGYRFKGDSFVLGGAVIDHESVPGCLVRVPFRTLNRQIGRTVARELTRGLPRAPGLSTT